MAAAALCCLLACGAPASRLRGGEPAPAAVQASRLYALAEAPRGGEVATEGLMAPLARPLSSTAATGEAAVGTRAAANASGSPARAVAHRAEAPPPVPAGATTLPALQQGEAEHTPAQLQVEAGRTPSERQLPAQAATVVAPRVMHPGLGWRWLAVMIVLLAVLACVLVLLVRRARARGDSAAASVATAFNALGRRSRPARTSLNDAAPPAPLPVPALEGGEVQGGPAVDAGTAADFAPGNDAGAPAVVAPPALPVPVAHSAAASAPPVAAPRPPPWHLQSLHWPAPWWADDDWSCTILQSGESAFLSAWEPWRGMAEAGPADRGEPVAPAEGPAPGDEDIGSAARDTQGPIMQGVDCPPPVPANPTPAMAAVAVQAAAVPSQPAMGRGQAAAVDLSHWRPALQLRRAG